jgi:hypothetical protein
MTLDEARSQRAQRWDLRARRVHRVLPTAGAVIAVTLFWLKTLQMQIDSNILTDPL